MLLGTLVQARVALLSPEPDSSYVMHTEILQSVVQQALNSSLVDSNSTDGCNLMPSLTDSLVDVMQRRGIRFSYRGTRCKPHTNEELQRLFYNTITSNCVTLAKVNVSGEESGSQEVLVAKTNSNCVQRMTMAPECFENGAFCAMSTKIKDLGYGYFPRFAISIECGGWRSNNREQGSRCMSVGHGRSYTLLKRVPNRCDEEGKEVWDEVYPRQEVNVACSCIRIPYSL